MHWSGAMNAREVVEQRIVTLKGLLDTPGGPLGPAAGSLGRDLAASWEAERRLLQRILHESRAGDVHATIAQWRERTAGFLERASEPAPSWSDRDGNTWDAREVIRILDDVRQRIDIWLAGERAPGPAADPPNPSARRDAAGAAKAEGAVTTEEDDDDDDDARYVNVLRPDTEP